MLQYGGLFLAGNLISNPLTRTGANIPSDRKLIISIETFRRHLRPLKDTAHGLLPVVEVLDRRVMPQCLKFHVDEVVPACRRGTAALWMTLFQRRLKRAIDILLRCIEVVVPGHARVLLQ